ncbi:MAG: hypothetical protein QOH06_1421 [Acidobacteriota bacterium]|jgi:hypothetical protein|nr:hypothetical protein [Acidobacteriota bacterium]
MEIQDLDQVRFVTRRFGELQGLRRLVPVGLLALSGAGLISLASWPLSAALLVGACLLLFRAGRYYRSNFGEAEPLETEAVADLSSLLTADGPVHRLQPAIPVVPRFLIVGGLACAVFILFQLLLWPPWVTIGSEVVHWSGDRAMTRTMLIQMLYGLCGLFFLGTWWMREQRQSQGYNVGIGLLLSGLSALSPWFAPAAVHLGVALLVCGSALVLAGLLDHWQLVRVLGHGLRLGEGD